MVKTTTEVHREHNAEQSSPPINENTPSLRAETVLLRIIATSRLLKVLKNDTRAIFTAASKAQAAADWMHAQQPGAEAVPAQIDGSASDDAQTDLAVSAAA